MRNERLTDRLGEVTNKRRNIAVSEAKRGKHTRKEVWVWARELHIAQAEGTAPAADERTVGCHGTCERYKAWNGKRQAERQERIKKTSLLHEADKRKSAAVSHYKRRGRQA